MLVFSHVVGEVWSTWNIKFTFMSQLYWNSIYYWPWFFTFHYIYENLTCLQWEELLPKADQISERFTSSCCFHIAPNTLDLLYDSEI